MRTTQDAMEGDAGLVGYLVDRLATKLPHRLGVPGVGLRDDELLQTTRITLVKLSQTSIDVVLDTLLALFDDIASPYDGTIGNHPSHVLEAEIYVLDLAAACCSEKLLLLNNFIHNTEGLGVLDETLVSRILDILSNRLEAVPESYTLAPQTLLDTPHEASVHRTYGVELTRDALVSVLEVERCVRTIIGFMTHAHWSSTFSYMKATIHSLRTFTMESGIDGPKDASTSDRGARVILRLLSYCTVDGAKLGQVLQEICSSYLHFRKACQNVVAVAVPLLITRWIERFPTELVELHRTHKRLDGGADTLFDMVLAATDNGRRRASLYPFQTTLLFLLPDIFEVASNLREAKGNNVIKKVAFLDALRKALRNGNEQASYCFVSLLRVARHFNGDSDSALVSYAMDVQDEVRDAVFRQSSNFPVFDQNMITAALVSLAHLNMDVCVDFILERCISNAAPMEFKLATIQTCVYFARGRSNPKHANFYQHILPFMKSHMQEFSSQKNGVLEVGPGKLSIELACNIFSFLSTNVTPLKDELANQAVDAPFARALFNCILSAVVPVRKQAMLLLEELHMRGGESYQFLDQWQRVCYVDMTRNLWSYSSQIIMKYVERISASNHDMSALAELHDYLKDRLWLVKRLPFLSNIPDEAPEAVLASSKLETVLLTSLCLPEVDHCQLVASSIGILLGECETINQVSESSKPCASILRNSEVLREIASPSFRITGMVAFQKRTRSLLRRLEFPTTAILNAWELAFEKWLHNVKEISVGSADSLDEKRLSEWRNLAGFLAAIGGICTADQAVILEEPALGGLRWIDRSIADSQEEPLLTRYLRLGIQLLASGNVRVREAIREILSREIALPLHQPLFKAVEHEVGVLLNGALAEPNKVTERELIFAEQTISLLKDMVEKLGSTHDTGTSSSVHLGALTLSFAKFIDEAAPSTGSLKIKVKICQLLGAVTSRREHLNLRDDVRIRNQLLEYIFGWIKRSTSHQVDYQNTSRMDETWRIQQDLDTACLKTLADLTFRLPLQPPDNQTDAGMSEMKSQMFHTYFNRFLSLLNHESSQQPNADHVPSISSGEEIVSNSELTITILSNLLSANIDVGLKHSLNIGYHESIEIRTAFIKVLHNILTQGTEISSLSDSAMNEKYDELLHLLTSDLSLAATMSTICPGAEIDELAVCLLTVFDRRGRIFDLFEVLIQQEVEQTEVETELLRRTSVVTKMLSLYAKWKGYNYLQTTLQNVMDRLMLTAQELDLELDPARVNNTEELQKNALQLQIVARVFMDDICGSASNIPLSFRKICSIIHHAVLPRFPNSKYTAVGAFVFLRFFCPAIVAPEVEGIVASTPSKEMRRGLLLIAKVIQNLANNVLFGTKEPYMFPLNQFLVQNISVVTSFLRDISSSPDHVEVTPSNDVFDFGSCVSFHRFLYDHWDHLRQTLVARERKEFVRAAELSSRGHSPILEPLRSLIANIGPPPLAISWNRPQISINNPSSYARFQNFMLRNAFRGTESFLTSRAVYDGGESKDGLSVVCVILRHSENEAIDYETLLYCYLKIASRLWHEPFILFVDATCYNGRNEPRDEFFKMLELLTPCELSQNLSRIYIYNMNSVFRRCFRRLLRVAMKNDDSIFNPNNVEYHLAGSLQELQPDFHLSYLHLPKETISVVTDTKYMFQPVTRLSKSKGEVDVVIKVGNQFVQITTVNKQEIISGVRLSTTINDIFRLGEIDEAATAFQIEDDASFALRADGGKILMCFSSPRKSEVLQTLRGTKVKQGKDSRTHKPFERLVRPQDVPGTLLNLVFANLISSDDQLRLASYNLLGALSRAFKFPTSTKLICAKDLYVPKEPSRFIVNVSRELARSEPQLTSDFLTEFFVSWETLTDEQKPISLAYVAPWISGLRKDVLANENDGEKGRDKVAAIFRKFIELLAAEVSLAHALEQSIMPLIAEDETLLDIFIEEMTKMAQSYGAQSHVVNTISSAVANIDSITLRAKLLSRLRKALNRSSLRPTRLLPDNAVWPEICVMLHICLSLSFNNAVQPQLFLPEIFHIVTMLTNTGSREIRIVVHKFLVNSIHAMCGSFPVDEAKIVKLRAAFDVLSEPKHEIIAPAVNTLRDGQSLTFADTGTSLAATENLVTILSDVCGFASTTVNMANSWRSRWMSLVASTAFQNNPAIQPRAFAVMGFLAREEVDDDLLYQVLVALRSSVSQFGNDGDSEMLTSIVSCLSRMMSNLPSASRYGLQLFWLAMCLIRLVPENLFNCTAHFLEAVLTNIGNNGRIGGAKVVPLLLQCRSQLNEAAQLLDDTYGIHFDNENFHFAVCACLIRGLTSATTRVAAVRVLLAFAELTSEKTSLSREKATTFDTHSPYITLIMARGIGHDDLRDMLWSVGLNSVDVEEEIRSFGRQTFSDLADKDLLLISAIELVDFQHLNDTAQARSLLWLNELAVARPAVFIHLCGAMPTILNDVLIHGQDSAALEAAHTLVQTLIAERNYSSAMGSTAPLNNLLEEMGFAGLWKSTFHGLTEDSRSDCLELTERLIELIVV